MSDGDILPSGWTLQTISQLISTNGVFCDGDWVESKDQDPDGEVRLIQLADVGDGKYRDRSSRFLTKEKAIELGCTFLRAGDVLIARMPDPLGRAVIFPGDDREAVTVVDVCIVRPDSADVSNRWLMHFVNSPQFRSAIASLQSGSTRQRISRKNLAKLAMPVPPPRQQEQLAATIDELFSVIDAGVAALERAKANLKRYRVAVLKAAVEGKLTEEWRAEHPDVEPASKLLERILTERRQKWEADQLNRFAAAGKQPPKNWQAKYVEPPPPDLTHLPELPNQWCWATIDQLCEVGTGTTPSRKNAEYYEGGAVPWILSSSVNKPFVDEAEEFVTQAALQDTTLRLYPIGTLLIALYGEGKTRGMVSELRIEAGRTT